MAARRRANCADRTTQEGKSMRDKPKLPDPEGVVTQQFVYDLMEAAVCSIVFCSKHREFRIEDTINDYRQEVGERFPAVNEVPPPS